MAIEYRGVAIAFNEKTGNFSAKFGGEHESRTSLAALKKAIDKSLESLFEPFAGFVCDRAYGRVVNPSEPGQLPEMKPVTVKGAKMNKSASWYDKFKFLLADDLLITEAVLADTPENRAAYLAAYSFRKESERIEKERKEKQEELDKALVWRLAREFFADVK